MNQKALRIIIDVILIGLGIVFLVFGIKDAIAMYNSTKIEDSVKFKSEYSYAPEDNVYEYINIKEMYRMLNSDTGIVLVGSPKDAWTQVLVSPLNDVIKTYKYKINYIDIDEIDKTSKYYESVLDTLNIDSFSTPEIIFVKDGNAIDILEKKDIYINIYNTIPIDYWSEDNKTTFETLLKKIVEELD